MTDQILNIKQVAEYLHVNERTVYRMAVAKKIPAFKVGAPWRFKMSEVEQWISEQKYIAPKAFDNGSRG